MEIRVTYAAGTVDQYPIEINSATELLTHFMKYRNVAEVAFIRPPTPSDGDMLKCSKCGEPSIFTGYKTCPFCYHRLFKKDE